MKKEIRTAAQAAVEILPVKKCEGAIRQIQNAGGEPGTVREGISNAADTIAVMAKEYPSLKCVGLIAHPGVNGGQPVPCYAMSGNLNTLEGWNAEAARVNRAAYIHENGHEPESNREMYEYIYKSCGLELPSPLPEWAK